MIKHSSKSAKTSPSRRDQPAAAGENMHNDLHELFLDEIADVYDAEKQLIKALPKMAAAAETDELRQAFESHLEETEEQAERLEDLAKSVGESIQKKTCAAMQGLIEEAGDLLKKHKNTAALDAALIAAAQKIEHYEIASYGTLCAWAEQLGHDEAFTVLREITEQERAADEQLTTIARSLANLKAQRE